jgi:hypothetical protein
VGVSDSWGRVTPVLGERGGREGRREWGLLGDVEGSKSTSE